jgi:hypothetical protein
MKRLLTLVLQLIGLLLLVPAVAIATLRYDTSRNDGPSTLFPGGELVAGELYRGPEPDWQFTNTVGTIELQISDPLSSRLVWILESEGKIYIACGYMGTTLGRLWKHWAVHADEGDGHAVIRINGVRYERQLVRIESGPALDGIAAKMASKYRSPTSLADIEAGNTWIFELAPPTTASGD